MRGIAAYQVAVAAAWGPATPSEQAAVIAELEERHGDVSLADQGAAAVRVFAAFARGDFAEATRLNDAVAAVAAELGDDIGVYSSGQIGSWIAMGEGRPQEAVEHLERDYGGLRDLGATSYASTIAEGLAGALYRCGRLDDAERFAIEGEELGSVEDVVNFALGRGVRAQIAADRGDLAEALRLGRDAVRYALVTDFPHIHGDTYLALAHVHHVAGNRDEERAALEQALAAYAIKEIRPLMAETERLLAAIPPPATG
jgi:tetratricopeptide (TPR) repeat protein